MYMPKPTESIGMFNGVPSHGPGLVIPSWTPDSLVGRTLEIIEAIGLPEKQENSVKNLVRDLIYAKISDSEGNAVFIDADLHDKIKEKVGVKLGGVNLESLK